jgi:hypothetical protein
MEAALEYEVLPSMQAVSPDAPVRQYEPATQAKHELWPVEGWYVPAGQEYFTPDVQYVPTGQALHSLEDFADAREVYPLLQILGETEPCTQNDPAVHARHDDAP